MAEFHIGLHYISMQHTGTENEFFLRILYRCSAETRIFSYLKVGGAQNGVYAQPKIWPKWRL